MLPLSQIPGLVQAKLAGRKIDVVGFIDELLSLVKEAGGLRCYLATDRRLRFELDGQASEVELESARSKLRMLCARLSVLCTGTNGSAVSSYGGEGTITSLQIPSPGWKLRFSNTPGEQEFTLTLLDANHTAGSATGAETAAT